MEDAGVVAGQPGRDELEHLGVGRRQVDVAAPHPARLAASDVLAHRQRLGVVDDDHVPLVGVGQGVGVQLVVDLEDRLLVIGDALLVALQRVVDRLGDVVELVAALDHAPLGVEPGVDHERDQRVLDLGHAAAERGGGEVQDALALERLRQPADLLGQRPSDQRVVVGERLVADIDLLHARELSNISGRHRRTRASPTAAAGRSSCGPPRECTAISPPMRWAISPAMARPRPLPDELPCGPRQKRSNRCRCESSSIPGPSSDTVRVTWPSSAPDLDPHLGALGVVAHGVVDQHPADLLHALLVADPVRQAARRPRQHHPAAVPRRQAAELAHEPAGGGGQVDRLVDHLDRARVEPRQVEQVGGELGQPRHLLAHRQQELLARGGVEVLLVQQLQEPRQREERRAQLVRGVGDEVLARPVDLGEPGLHEVERAGQAAELVRVLVADGLVEAAGGDPARGRLELADPARDRHGEPPADDDRHGEREAGRDQDPVLDERRRRVDVADALRQQHDAVRHPDRDHDAAARRAAAADPGAQRGPHDAVAGREHGRRRPGQRA